MHRTFDYDTIRIGEIVGCKDILITDELIRNCAHAIGSTHSWYFENSPFGGRIAPPTIFDNETLDMFDAQFENCGSIHAEQAWEFEYPARLGKRVTITLVVADKFFRRERPYIVMRLTAMDEDGITLCHGTHTALITFKAGTAH